MGIKVFCRVKDDPINHKILSENISNISIPYKNKIYESNVNVLWQNTDNSSIFNCLNKHSIFNNNYWILFGFTGTGKTYTTMGILNELLNRYKNNVSVSAIQIYNNDIYDLFTNNKLKYFKTNKLIIRNMTSKSLINENDIKRFLKTLDINRSKNKTNYNNTSSRSHAIIYINVDSKKYTIVDMAGQESGIQYNNKQLKNEGNVINLNMLALKECIRALYLKKKFIPYRQTLLTFALKHMFSGNMFLAFICTISTKLPVYNQIDSLNYADQLFKCSEKNSEFDYSDLVKDYNEYLNECGWYNCQELKLGREMNNFNFKNIRNIKKYLEKKLFWINKLKKNLSYYEKINPELEYSFVK